MASERLPSRPACLLVASGAAEGEAREDGLASSGDPERFPLAALRGSRWKPRLEKGAPRVSLARPGSPGLAGARGPWFAAGGTRGPVLLWQESWSRDGARTCRLGGRRCWSLGSSVRHVPGLPCWTGRLGCGEGRWGFRGAAGPGLCAGTPGGEAASPWGPGPVASGVRGRRRGCSGGGDVQRQRTFQSCRAKVPGEADVGLPQGSTGGGGVSRYWRRLSSDCPEHFPGSRLCFFVRGN